MSDSNHDIRCSEGLIQELLTRWEDRFEHGEEIDVHTLCWGHPRLAEELERRIQALRNWNRFNRRSVSDPTNASTGQQDLSEPLPDRATISLDLTDLQFHARGGLGVICSAQDRRLGRELALKYAATPREPHLESEAKERFLREVKVTAALEHPGIVPVHGLGTDSQGRLCYAMRLIAGKTLGKAIAEFYSARQAQPQRRLPELRRDVEFRSLLQRLRSACVTVAYAHSKGFLHRDLKPDHILLGTFDLTLVVDWGLTKQIGAPEPAPTLAEETLEGGSSLNTQTGIGTLGFASQEQQSGNQASVGPASDVFSLGATLYVLLTNRLPFFADSAAEVIRLVEQGLVVPPRKHNPQVPRPLEAICLKALANRPEDRYQTANALADDLERWLADAPVAAFHEPLTLKARRVLDQHSLALMLTLAAIGGGVASGTASWYRSRLQDQENRSLAYATLEQSVREEILTRRLGWTTRGLGQIAEANRIDTKLRSAPVLRGLAIGCQGGVDLRSRTRLTSMPAGCLAFSPGGKRLVVGEQYGTGTFRVQWIDIDSGRLLREYVIAAHPDVNRKQGILSLRFSPDARWLAMGLRDGRLLICPANDDTVEPEQIGQLPSFIVGLGFTPDGNSLVWASGDGQLALSQWSHDRGWREVRRVRVAAERLSDMVLSPDGKRAICSGRAGIDTLEVQSLRGQGEVQITPSRVRRGIDRLAISPDGQRLAISCASFQTLTIGNEPSPDGMVDDDFGMAHQEETTHVEFSPDGSLVVTGSADSTLKLWDLVSFRMVLKQPAFTEGGVYPVFDAGGRRLAVGTSEGVDLYDLLGREAVQPRAVGSEIVTDFAFLGGVSSDLPDVVTLRSTSDHDLQRPGALDVWTGSQPSPSSSFPLTSNTLPKEAPLAIAANSDQRRIALVYKTDIFYIDLTKYPLNAVPIGIDSAEIAGFSRDGKSIWAVTKHYDIVGCQIDRIAPKFSWHYTPPDEPRGRKGVSCLDVGQNWVVAATLAGRILVASTADGKFQLLSARSNDPVQTVALSPDESIIACGTQRGKIDLIRRRDCQFIDSIKSDTERIEQIRFHPSGRFLATVARDQELTLWSFQNGSLTKKLRFSFLFRRAVGAIHFSPDGRWLGLSRRGERGIRIWDLDRIRQELEAIGLDESADEISSDPKPQDEQP